MVLLGEEEVVLLGEEEAFECPSVRVSCGEVDKVFADRPLEKTLASAARVCGQSCGGDVAAIPEWRLACTVPTEAKRTDALQAT